MKYLKIIFYILISIIILIGIIFVLKFFDGKKQLEKLQNEISALKKNNSDYVKQINNKNENIKYITKEILVKIPDSEKTELILQLKKDILDQAKGFTFRLTESEKMIDALNNKLKWAYKKNMIFFYAPLTIDQDLEIALIPSLNYARNFNLKFANIYIGTGLGIKIYYQSESWKYGGSIAMILGLQF